MKLALVPLVLLVGCGDDAPGFAPLFNGTDLDGWYSWLPSQGQNSDPRSVFAIEDGMLHILGTDIAPADFEFGYLATEREYESFHLRFDYKWGVRHYVNFPKDSGVFFGMVGPDQLWPRSIECQVMVNDTGSVYVFDNATLTTTIDPNKGDATYLEGGLPYTTPRIVAPFPRVTHSAMFDSIDDWNTVEIIVEGDTSELIVNGNVTFRGTRHTQPDPDAPMDPARDLPLTKGRIVIQQEGAELYYRNVELMPLATQ